MTPSPKPAPPVGGQKPNWRVIRIVASIVLAFLGGFVYLIYGAETQTGLGGYLMAIEMNVFGSARPTDAVMMGMILPLLVLWAIAWVAQKLFGKDGPAVPSANAGPAIAYVKTTPSAGLSWKAILIMGVLPLVAGAVIAPVLYWIDQHDQRQTVYAVDLTEPQSTLPKGAKFVEVKGLVARRYLTGYKERATQQADYDLQLFAPITAPGWTAADPVRLVLHRTALRAVSARSSSTDIPEVLPDSFTQRGLVITPGKVSTALPVIIEQHFKAKGLTIAPSAVVVEWTELPNHQVPATNNYQVALIICGICSITIFLITASAKLMIGITGRRKRQASAIAT